MYSSIANMSSQKNPRNLHGFPLISWIIQVHSSEALLNPDKAYPLKYDAEPLAETTLEPQHANKHFVDASDVASTKTLLPKQDFPR